MSVTTRKPRPGEVDGKDYFFIDAAEFERMKAAGELLEWAQVFDNRYATPRAPVMAALAAGSDMLFDIDWQGAQQLKAQLPDDVASVFILPPDGKALERRLQARGSGQRRGRGAAHGGGRGRDRALGEYDYVLVNSDLDDELARPAGDPGRGTSEARAADRDGRFRGGRPGRAFDRLSLAQRVPGARARRPGARNRAR